VSAAPETAPQTLESKSWKLTVASVDTPETLAPYLSLTSPEVFPGLVALPSCSVLSGPSSIVLIQGEGKGAAFVAGTMTATEGSRLVRVAIEVRSSAGEAKFNPRDVSLRDEGKQALTLGAIGFGAELPLATPDSHTRDAAGGSTVTLPKEGARTITYVFLAPKTGSLSLAVRDAPGVSLEGVKGAPPGKQVAGTVGLAGVIDINQPIPSGSLAVTAAVADGSLEYKNTVAFEKGDRLAVSGSRTITTEKVEEVLAGATRRREIPILSWCTEPSGASISYLPGIITVASSIAPLDVQVAGAGGTEARFRSAFRAHKGDKLAAIGSGALALSVHTASVTR